MWLSQKSVLKLCQYVAGPFFHVREEWRDCIAVELINRPVPQDGPGPPVNVEVTDQSVVPLPLCDFFAGDCDPFQIFVYEASRFGSKTNPFLLAVHG